MSQASGIIPPRARFFGTRASTASKRQLGIERLELRCPLDASAALSGSEVESLLGGGVSPLNVPAVPAITSTLHTARSEGAEQRALPPQQHQNPAPTQASTKALTAVRRAALAKRTHSSDPLQLPSQGESVPSHSAGNDAGEAASESPALETPAPPDSRPSDEPQDRQATNQSPELIADNLEQQVAPIELGSSDLDPTPKESSVSDEPSQGSKGGSSGTTIVDDPFDPTHPDPVGSSGDDTDDPLVPSDPPTSTDPLAPADLLPGDPNCSAVKPDPARFPPPPGPAGSIALVPPGRGRSDYWTSGNMGSGGDDEPEVIAGTSAIRQPRFGRGESALSRGRYYEALAAGDEPPVDAFPGRTTPLRGFVRQLDPLDGGIAIEGTSESPTEYAALTHEPPRSVPVEPAESADTAANHADQTDLAITALVAEAADTEPLASEAAPSCTLVTTVSLALHQSCESVQVCSGESGDDVVVSLSPAQDFMANLSRWAALGLLVSHRLSHHITGRSRWLNWLSEARGRMPGGRSRSC